MTTESPLQREGIQDEFVEKEFGPKFNTELVSREIDNVIEKSSLPPKKYYQKGGSHDVKSGGLNIRIDRKEDLSWDYVVFNKKSSQGVFVVVFEKKRVEVDSKRDLSGRMRYDQEEILFDRTKFSIRIFNVDNVSGMDLSGEEFMSKLDKIKPESEFSFEKVSYPGDESENFFNRKKAELGNLLNEWGEELKYKTTSPKGRVRPKDGFYESLDVEWENDPTPQDDWSVI